MLKRITFISQLHYFEIILLAGSTDAFSQKFGSISPASLIPRRSYYPGALKSVLVWDDLSLVLQKHVVNKFLKPNITYLENVKRNRIFLRGILDVLERVRDL